MAANDPVLPRALYRAAQVRELDHAAIEKHKIPGGALMERAGEAAFAVLCQLWPGAKRILVCSGAGQNGGDGFVVARLAQTAGLQATVAVIGKPKSIRGDALANLECLRKTKVSMTEWKPELLNDADVIVDALLGTGLDRPVSGRMAEVITAINACGKPVLAVDVPSGLNADTGQPRGAAIQAQATVTFVGMKAGLLTGSGPDYCGRINFADLGIPAAVYDAVPPAVTRISRSDGVHHLPRRARASHKGHFGHVLVIGGDHGYAGAVRMAAEAAGRIGSGLVSVATQPAHAPMISAARPEIMAHGVADRRALGPLLKNATVIALGPGLGQSDWAQDLLGAALEQKLPLVVDADALNLIALDPITRTDWVLTPHPGEAARLLRTDTAAVQADRYAAAQAVRERYGGVCVLKGCGTIVATPDGLHVCDAGNPGMASGGMGDVLTGVIAGLLAQGLSISDAARHGVCVHAEAADQAAAQGGERGMLATDLMTWLRRLVN
ncbi:MAG TPA: NAD(P)H-hydrate dehydratase [Gammaproteobacteria bacterium]|nr:NAD(P)H-hydrate dehydratase [Gammaproteobacteria bacterium]